MAVVLANMPSYTAGMTPRGIIGGSAPSSSLASPPSLRRRSKAAAGGRYFRCEAKIKPQDIVPEADVDLSEAKEKLKAKGRTFWEALAFDGPGPERINGRLAMLGFVSALAVEVARGQDLADQLANGGALWFIGTAALFSVASLVPLFRGVDAPERSNGPMTADAELWNGRFAMLGLVGLAFTEFLKGGPLV
ncbi:early light-induced protein 1, chloroplastic [Phalaenopsis equestris]|uniref:early light-induced protein 1, chloroplastic n=1 Tax=Phalaenopsis equestris TaxID=78828 RepID=UPI0009E4CE4E|nr:early light-induced protein 1, chloroplastic [Phalaenopsis equestris]